MHSDCFRDAHAIGGSTQYMVMAVWPQVSTWRVSLGHRSLQLCYERALRRLRRRVKFHALERCDSKVRFGARRRCDGYLATEGVKNEEIEVLDVRSERGCWLHVARAACSPL